MSRTPYLKVYWGDFLASTHGMSGDARKAYLVLLLAAWERDAALPDDDAMLARLAMCSTKGWRRIRAEVMAKWVLGADGRYRQARLTAEFRAARGVSRTADSGPPSNDLGSRERPSDDEKPKEIKDRDAGKISPIAIAIASTSTDGFPPTPRENAAGMGREAEQADNGGDGEGEAVTETARKPLTRAEADRIAAELLDAAGPAITTIQAGLAVLTAPLSWVARGAIWDVDVIPVIRAVAARRKPGSVRSWDYFTEAVMAAVAYRTTGRKPRRRRPGQTTWADVAKTIEGGADVGPDDNT